MRSSRYKGFVAIMVLSASVVCVNVLAQTPQAGARTQQPQAQAQPKPQARPKPPSITGVGSAPTQEDMGNLAFVSGPSGKGLPPGSGTAKQGAPIYLAKCSMCHGQDAHGVVWQPGAFSPVAGPALTGGPKSAPPNNPWVPPITRGAPFPEVIFNTIAVEMPMFRAGTLKPDEIYALAAFIFFKNGVIKEDEVMNRETLPQIQLPNRSFFPTSDDVYMDMKKRGCYQTYGVCLGN